MNQGDIKINFSTVESWLQSGLKQKEFSVKHRLNFKNFNYWVRKHRKIYPEKHISPTCFVELKPSEAIPSNNYHLEVYTTKGNKLNFTGSLSNQTLITILDAL